VAAEPAAVEQTGIKPRVAELPSFRRRQRTTAPPAASLLNAPPGLGSPIEIPPVIKDAKANHRSEIRLPAELISVSTRDWDEVIVRSGASELEKLTFVPGVVGDIVDWIVQGARRPNRAMALAVATAVVGTLVGRRIEGPTGSATHLYIIILAPTGYGKDWPLNCGGRLMEAAGAGGLLGPHEFASAPGLEKRMARNPLMACFVDELGDELALINNQNNNAFVSKLFWLFKKCYNAWATIITAEKVNTESEKIIWPAIAIVGVSTSEKFFSALRPGDSESGFANRLLILPFEGTRRPPEQDVSGAEEPPKNLVAELKLHRQASTSERILNSQPGQKLERTKMPWGPGAKEVYVRLSGQMDQLEESDPGHYELGMRVSENAVRLATIVAVGRGSNTVDRRDIEWAAALAKRSFDAAKGGFDKYMREYFEFPKFCEAVLSKIRDHGGERSSRDLARDFRSNQRWGTELDKALKQLMAEGLIKRIVGGGSRGPSSERWRLTADDTCPEMVAL
jgi:hypothetical protein